MAGKEHPMTAHDLWTLDALIEAYRKHQRRTRGLREKTLHGYEQLVRLFVLSALEDDPNDPRRLSPAGYRPGTKETDWTGRMGNSLVDQTSRKTSA